MNRHDPRLDSTRRSWCLTARPVLLLGLLTGCVGSSQPASFYTLSALSQASSPAASSDLAVLVGPMTLPGYLDRPQMVTRSTAHRLKVDEYHRWAGTLKEEMLRVVTENLSRLLGSTRVLTFSNEGRGTPDYRVLLDVRRFDGLLDGKVVLRVHWTVERLSPREPLAQQRSELSEPSANDPEALVAAQSRLLARLSQQIAAVLRQAAR